MKFFTILFGLTLTLSLSHPVHVSVASIEHDIKNGVFTVSVKMFANDFEDMFHFSYNVVLKANNDSLLIENEDLIMNYLRNNLKIYPNQSDKSLSYQLTRFYYDGESIWFTLSGEFRKNLKNIRIDNTILMDYFYDQMNLIIFVTGDYQDGFTATSGNSIAVFTVGQTGKR